MSFTRYCEGMRQPCPTPHSCQVDCHFNTADLTVGDLSEAAGSGHWPERLYQADQAPSA